MSTTFADLRIDVIQYAGQSSHNKIEVADTTKLDAEINKRRRQFARLALTHWDGDVVLTSVDNQAIYDIEDSTTPAVARKMVRIEDVVINGNQLRNFHGYGPTSQHELSERYPAWQTTTKSTPSHWLREMPHHIRLYPAPDTNGYSDTYVSGWYLPEDAASDSEVMTEDETTLDYMAMFIASHVIGRPYEDVHLVERAIGLHRESMAAAEELKAEALRKHHAGDAIRGKRDRNRIKTIGR